MKFPLRSIIAILLIMFFNSCNETKTKKKSEEKQAKTERDFSEYKYVLKFEGNLRCADCPGIATSITFVNDNLRFYETDEYMEKNITAKDSGSYTTERGFKNDEDATVYVLHDDKPGSERRLLRWHDESLVIIDGNGNVADTTTEFRLYKVQ